MSVDRVSTQEPDTHPPEGVDRELRNVVGFLLANGKDLTTWRSRPLTREQARSSEQYISDFEDLGPFIDALKCLDDKMEIKPTGPSLLKNLAAFACKCAGEKIDTLDSTTHLTMKLNDPRMPLGLYWPESLKAFPENPASLSGMGGVYDILVQIDHPTTTGGAEELQEAVSALALHYADITAAKATEPINSAFENITPDGLKARKKLAESSQAYLARAKANGREPVRSSKDYYSHDSSLRIHKGEAVRRETPPENDKVRIFRASADGKTGWYIDLNLSQFQSLRAARLQGLLTPSDSKFKPVDLDGEWVHFNDGLSIWDKEKEPPAFSVSSGIYGNGNTEVQKAATCGNSKVHVAFDYGGLILQSSHVTENGAGFKLGSSGVAIEVQKNRHGNEPLQPFTLPQTEIRPPYARYALPREAQLSMLGNTEATRQAVLDFFGLSNLRIRFPDITPEQTRPLTMIMNKLNQKYREPRILAMKKYIAEHPATPLDEASIERLIDLIAPPLTLDDMFTIGASQVLGPTASNMLPDNIRKELTHPSVAVMKKLGEHRYNIDSQEFMNKFRGEKILGKFGLNIYNVYKLVTLHWRNLPVLGAMDLGKVFSNALASYMEVQLHVSTLGPRLRRVGKKLAQHYLFETAKPDPNERYANALALFIDPEDDAYRVKASFRDNLTTQMLNYLPIENSPQFTPYLDEVTKDLTRTLSVPQQEVVKTQVGRLYEEWKSVSANLNNPGAPKVLMALVLKHEEALRRSTDSPLYRAFQILLSSGMRRYRAQVITHILKMEI